MMEFTVVKMSSAHNSIVDRPSMYNMNGVVSSSIKSLNFQSWEMKKLLRTTQK